VPTLDEIAVDLRTHFPQFCAREVDGIIEACGGHSVLSNEGQELDRYGLRIVVPKDFPEELPVVFETTGKIPRTADYHVNPDGSCCIGVKGAIFKWLGKGFPLSSYLRGPLKNYFVFQALKAQGQSWQVGEAEHGNKGIYDFWKAELGDLSPTEMVGILAAASKGKCPPKNGKCPCGSRVRSRKCHGRLVGRLGLRYPKQLLLEESEILKIWMPPQ
jgi:hypothetical protein